jgi:hypothetical protein
MLQSYKEIYDFEDRSNIGSDGLSNASFKIFPNQYHKDTNYVSVNGN